ncbi:MAG TPA: biopolymer transporter ExbD [Candidatus Polarisedimenticolaceae bacterium]|nr:biopolymer transporter ExbD [Candidatus Polarisedimenticolaceae bacterium]
MQLGEPRKMQSAINVTPLVDVVLVLLIIFMVMAPHMRQGPGPEIDLPATAKPREQANVVRIVVTIDEHGALWIDDKSFTVETFGDGLRAAAGTQTDVKVVVQGDARLPFGEVRQTMLAIEQAGFHGVGLIAERADIGARRG